jgi:hypothetical protein
MKDEVVAIASKYFLTKMLGAIANGSSQAETYLSEFRILAKHLVDLTASTLEVATSPCADFIGYCNAFTRRWAISGAKPIRSHILWEYLMQNLLSKLYASPHEEEDEEMPARMEQSPTEKLIENIDSRFALADRSPGAPPADSTAGAQVTPAPMEQSPTEYRTVSISGKDCRLALANRSLRSSPVDATAGAEIMPRAVESSVSWKAQDGRVVPVFSSVSDEEALRLLIAFVEANGGSVPATRGGNLYDQHWSCRFGDKLYQQHAGLKERVGKLPDFCAKHPEHLLFFQDGNMGVLLSKRAITVDSDEEALRLLVAFVEASGGSVPGSRVVEQL